MTPEDIDWPQILWHLYYLAIAYALALPIGWDRERNARSAGLRTFPLVSMASCAYMLTGIQVLDSTDAEARVLYGLITGMGFIGGGAILKDKGSVAGTATAASLWNTGAVGMAVAWNRFEIAISAKRAQRCHAAIVGRAEIHFARQQNETRPSNEIRWEGHYA